MGYSRRSITKVDANQPVIVAALRTVGALVVDMSGVGRGFPDLVATRHGRAYFIEVKRPGEELNDIQVEFLTKWTGPTIHVVHTALEALEVVCATTDELDAHRAALEAAEGRGGAK